MEHFLKENAAIALQIHCFFPEQLKHSLHF